MSKLKHYFVFILSDFWKIPRQQWSYIGNQSARNLVCKLNLRFYIHYIKQITKSKMLEVVVVVVVAIVVYKVTVH